MELQALHRAKGPVRPALGTALMLLGQIRISRRRGPIQPDTENWQPMPRQFVNWSIAVVVVIVAIWVLLYWRSKRGK